MQEITAMNAKTPRQRRAARRERIALRQEAQAAAEAAMQAHMGGKWVTRAELYNILTFRRARYNIRLIASASSTGGTLARKHVPYYRYGEAMRNKKYLLSSALTALTRRGEARPPAVRTGTEKDIASGRYIPLSAACDAFRCHSRRLLSAIYALNLIAFCHPITNRLWVDKEQARSIAEHRTARFIRSVLPPEQAEHLLLTRPSKRQTKTSRVRVYWVPEISHLGSKNTAYIPKYSNI